VRAASSGASTTTIAGNPITARTSSATRADDGYGTCAVRATGETVCWGENDQGQAGNGTTASSPTPVTVSGVARATAISVGTRFACALIPSRVACWGTNDAGQVGVPGGDGQRVLSPILVDGV